MDIIIQLYHVECYEFWLHSISRFDSSLKFLLIFGGLTHLLLAVSQTDTNSPLIHSLNALFNVTGTVYAVMIGTESDFPVTVTHTDMGYNVYKCTYTVTQTGEQN